MALNRAGRAPQRPWGRPASTHERGTASKPSRIREAPKRFPHVRFTYGSATVHPDNAEDIGMELMKTMTCKQLGGPCDLALSGDSADDVIKAQDRHLKDIVGSGDVAHEPALKAMKGRWKNPISGMSWYKQVKRDFAAL